METNNLKPVYDCAYFIKKFEPIPEDKWNTKSYQSGDAYCVLGFCGMRNYMNYYNDESNALYDLIFISLDGSSVININDELDPKYKQPTPKQRILAALYDIRKMHRVEKVINDLYPELSTTTVEDLIKTNSHETMQ